MERSDALASALGDAAWAAERLPRACPCSYGPGDRYTLQEAIGTGWDSVVYRAIDHRMSAGGRESLVAIKIRESGADAGGEAVLARAVSHPNVVHTYDHGRAPDGSSYAVFELLEARDLSQIERPLRPAAAVAIMAGVSAGVAAIHRAGLVHGDLKPQNVLLTEDGTPKVADFDLARGRDERRGGGGNLAFAAPELLHAEARKASPPADVFALAGMLYWLIRGEYPLGDTPEDVRARLIDPEFAPPELGKGRDLSMIVRRAMAREPEARHASAAALAEDLHAWRARRPIPWTRPGALRLASLWAQRRPIRAGVTLAAAVLLLAGVLGAWAWDRAEQRRAAELREHRLRLRAESNEKAAQMAEAEVERIKAQARGLIEAFVSSGWMSEDGGDESAILARMAVADWMGTFSVFPEAGAVLTPEERVEQLTTVLAEMEETGDGGRSVDTLLVRYSLALFLTKQGEPDEALTELRTIRRGWQDSLRLEDSLWRCLEGLELVNRALKLRQRGEPLPQELAADLAQARETLDAAYSGEPVANLIDNLDAH